MKQLMRRYVGWFVLAGALALPLASAGCAARSRYYGDRWYPHGDRWYQANRHEYREYQKRHRKERREYRHGQYDRDDYERR